MKNKEGHTLFITIIILMFLSMMCLGSMLLVANDTKITSKKVNMIYQEVIITNSLFDVLNDLVEKEEIELKEYKYNDCIVYVTDSYNNIYYIEIYENDTKLITQVEFDLINNEYNLITLEVIKNV